MIDVVTLIQLFVQKQCRLCVAFPIVIEIVTLVTAVCMVTVENVIVTVIVTVIVAVIVTVTVFLY